MSLSSRYETMTREQLDTELAVLRGEIRSRERGHKVSARAPSVMLKWLGLGRQAGVTGQPETKPVPEPGCCGDDAQPTRRKRVLGMNLEELCQEAARLRPLVADCKSGDLGVNRAHCKDALLRYDQVGAALIEMHHRQDEAALLRFDRMAAALMVENLGTDDAPLRASTAATLKLN